MAHAVHTAGVLDGGTGWSQEKWLMKGGSAALAHRSLPIRSLGPQTKHSESLLLDSERSLACGYRSRSSGNLAVERAQSRGRELSRQYDKSYPKGITLGRSRVAEGPLGSAPTACAWDERTREGYAMPHESDYQNHPPEHRMHALPQSTHFLPRLWLCRRLPCYHNKNTPFVRR